MFHPAYPASWLLGNQSQQKSFVTYGDISFLTVDPGAAFVPYGHLSPIYTSPIILDVQGMKRVPVNLLMRNFESLNCFVPVWPRKDLNRTISERVFSRDSLADSGNGSDAASVNSRSSTPTSDGTPCASGAKVTIQSEEGLFPGRRQRKLSEPGNFPYSRSVRQKHPQFSNRNCSTVHTITPEHPITPKQIQHSLQYILRGDQWDKVSQEVWLHYLQNRQPEEMYFRKMKLRTTIHAVLSQAFPNCGLSVVGSSVNGLGTNTSDIDMCLILTSTEIDQQTEAMFLLRCVQRILDNCSFIKSTELITAKVPILKFADKLDIQVDLNINNTVGIANTHLIRNYCVLDWRVQPLVLMIKRWAQDCDINNAKEMTLSSYSLTLMVLHYFQCGCNPMVLPCLQKMRPDSHDVLPHFKSRNTESLGKLLFGFFNYYSNMFDFDRDVMSVRLGCKLPKHVAMNYRSAKNKKGHWKYICIEEPFNRTNTACAVYDAECFARILTAFRMTYVKLNATKDMATILKL